MPTRSVKLPSDHFWQRLKKIPASGNMITSCLSSEITRLNATVQRLINSLICHIDSRKNEADGDNPHCSNKILSDCAALNNVANAPGKISVIATPIIISATV